MISPALDVLSGISDENPQLADYLQSDRCAIDLEVSSRKRLFEELANIASSNCFSGEVQLMLPLTADCVLDTLKQRERLGSTAIGNGIVLPHGRIAGLPQPIISVIRLKTPIDYDAPDQIPVWLAVCLLVPENANQAHLDLLAELANCLNDETFVKAIREAQTGQQIQQLFSSA